MSKKMIRNFAAFALALCMLLTNLGAWNLALAEDSGQVEQSEEANETKDETKEEPQENEEEDKEEPQGEEPQGEEPQLENKENELESKEGPKEGDGLEISDEIIPGAVEAAETVQKPTINTVKIGDKVITGGGLIGANKRKAKNAGCKIIVTVKNASGTVVETGEFSLEVKGRAREWTVNLTNPVEEGYTVTAKQEFNGDTSEEASFEVKKTLATQYKDKLKMPTGEIWIEQTSASLVNDDEKAEAIDLLKKANPTIANDIKSVEFTINGTSNAYFTVTYTDDSTSDKIEATGLTIKEVTEVSAAPIVDTLYIADGKVTGKLSGNGPFTNAKVKLVKFKKIPNNFCTKDGCETDKDTTHLSTVEVNQDGTFAIPVNDETLEIGKNIGIIVKEPRKRKNCSTTQPQYKIPENIEVRDPKKLTDIEKDEIRKKIREANTTTGGTSKMPDGTGYKDGIHAYIDFTPNVIKIISPNDVEGTWPGGKFKPNTNTDGSLKLEAGKSPKKTVEPKDILKNLAPNPPKVELSKDKKSITVTPDSADTDATEVSVKYTPEGEKTAKEVTAKKDPNTNKWSISPEVDGIKVDEKTGAITINTDKVKGGTNVTGSVKDAGFSENNQEPESSKNGTTKFQEADKLVALGGLEAVDMKLWVGDDLDWKKGVKASSTATEAEKTKINNLLAEASTTAADATATARTTGTQGDYTGKIKVTFSDGSTIEVDGQKLYVSNKVSAATKENLPDDAIEVEFKLGEGVKVNNTTTGAVEGDKDNPTSYAKYKVKPNTNLKTYVVPVLNSNVVDSIKLTAKDGYTEAKWNTTDFVATATNKVFTATATKTYKVTVQANGGTGDEKVETIKKDSTYKLPAADTFTAPANKEFAGWQVGNETKKAGDTITITADVTVKAIWKAIEFKVSFNAGDGSGTMNEVTVTKGSEYKLPACGFTAPSGKEFAGWKVGDQEGVKQANDKIKISGAVTLTATWKAKPVTPPNPKPKPNPDPDDYRPHRPHRPYRPSTPDKDNDNNNNKDKDKNDHKKDPNEPSITENPDGTTTVTPNNNDDSVNIKGKDKDGKPIDVVVEKDKDGKWHVDKDASVSVDPKTGKITIAKGVKDITAKSIIKLERGTHYKYIYGYPDGTVRPEGLITRAEAAALIARIAMLDMSDKAKPNFKDTPSMWYNSAINVVVKKNLMLADDGKFRPNEAITRAEFARALFYIDAKNAAVAPFADVKGHKFEEAINQAYGNGRIAGYPDGTFRPDAFIKRAEAAKILNHYARRGVDSDGIEGVEIFVSHFTDLKKSHWAYYEIMEAANTHEYERRVNTVIETWNKIK